MTDPDEYRQLIADLDDELASVYRRRRVVMEKFAAEHETVLPEKKARTETQRRVERCPRCGGRLE